MLVFGSERPQHVNFAFNAKPALILQGRFRVDGQNRFSEKRFYWKNSPMEGATADAPGISLTLSSCSIVRSSD